MAAVKDLGVVTEGDFFDQVLQWEGLQVVDVGCADGTFAKMLVQRGAVVLGLEPDAQVMQKNREAAPLPNLTIEQSGAECIPALDASKDVVVFKYSLHHVPGELHAAAFKEAARVLKPGGKLLVLEPVASGNFNHIMQPFHDETEVRRVAQESLVQHATEHFVPEAGYTYQTKMAFADYDAYVNMWHSKLSFNTFTIEDVKNEETKKRFASLAGADGSIILHQPVKADLFVKK